MHHAAHGLVVRDTAVELFDPRLQRLRHAAGSGLVDTRSDAVQALRQPGRIELAVLEHGVEPQHGGGHLHGQGVAGRLARGRGSRRCRLQRVRQHFAIGEEALQRVAEQGKGLGHRTQAARLAASHGRPHVLGGRDALACLHDQAGVEAPQPRCLVVGAARAFSQGPGLAHGVQARRPAGLRRIGAGAEEQQIAGQALGDFVVTAHVGAQLRKQARCHALGVEVAVEQTTGLGVEESRSQTPGGGRQSAARTSTELGAEVAQPGFGLRIRAAQQGQDEALHRVACFIVGSARGESGFGRQFMPMPAGTPQIGRVDAVTTGELLHGAVLRKERHTRHRPTRQQALHVVDDGEGRALDGLHRPGVDDRGLVDHALHGAFAGAQHLGRDRQTDELERAHALVQLHARRAQDGRIGRVDVRHPHGQRFLEVAAQPLVRGVERALQLVRHPGHGAEVVPHARVCLQRCCHRGF